MRISFKEKHPKLIKEDAGWKYDHGLKAWIHR